MTPLSISEAKRRLDYIIDLGRVDLYKPIHIAEVLYHSRVDGIIDAGTLDTFQSDSRRWRNAVTMRLLGKRPTSSARYLEDVWSETAMPPQTLVVLDRENKETNGAVERYVYVRFNERQSLIGSVFASITVAEPSPPARATRASQDSDSVVQSNRRLLGHIHAYRRTTAAS